MTKILDAVRQKSVEKAEAKAVLTQEMLARNGRHPPKPRDLSNNLAEGNNKPKQPVPGVYDDWSSCMPEGTTFQMSTEGAAALRRYLDWRGRVVADLEMARALVEAGYMPLPEYIEMYGDDDGA
jgi:hypothetical protein